MFFDWKGIAIAIAVLGAVVALCAVDLSCSAKPAEESTIAKVKGEIAVGKAAVRNQQADDLARVARDMRVMARKYVEQGDMPNARKTMNAAQEIERKIQSLRNER